MYICYGITSGRVLNRELYAQKIQKLIYPHLLTSCFKKFSLQSQSKIKKNKPRRVERNRHETVFEQLQIN